MPAKHFVMSTNAHTKRTVRFDIDRIIAIDEAASGASQVWLEGLPSSTPYVEVLTTPMQLDELIRKYSVRP